MNISRLFLIAGMLFSWTAAGHAETTGGVIHFCRFGRRKPLLGGCCRFNGQYAMLSQWAALSRATNPVAFRCFTQRASTEFRHDGNAVGGSAEKTGRHDRGLSLRCSTMPGTGCRHNYYIFRPVESKPTLSPFDAPRDRAATGKRG